MKVIYVAGPYRDKRGGWYVQLNIRAAEGVAMELWRMGAAAICPHLNTLHFDGPLSINTILQGDFEILSRCDALVALPGWERSLGTMAEIEVAASLDIPVFYWPDGIRDFLNTPMCENAHKP